MKIPLQSVGKFDLMSETAPQKLLKDPLKYRQPFLERCG